MPCYLGCYISEAAGCGIARFVDKNFKSDFMLHPSYTIVCVTGDKVFLVDDNIARMRSVTNAAEEVVAEVYAKHPGKRIIYRDTDGIWGELLHLCGQFDTFDDYTGELPEGF